MPEPRIASGRRWNFRDIYVQARFGHDHLWVGVMGFGPDGEHVGTRMVSDGRLRRVLGFLDVPNIEDRIEYMKMTVEDMASWDEDRWERWSNSFAAVYSELSIGGGRYTIEGSTPEERVIALDRTFEHMQQEGAS